MIKKLLSIAFILLCVIANAQSFSLTYSFTAVTPTTGTTDPTPVPTATGITSGSFLAYNTPGNAPSASGRFSFQGWSTGATDMNDNYSSMTGSISNSNEYYEITLTPVSGYTVSLTTITFGVRRSGTGIRSYAVRSSSDAYMSNLPASVGTNTNLSVVGLANEFFWKFDATSTSSDQNGSQITLSGAPNFSNDFVAPITFRFYGWNSEAGGASGGTFSIDNVTINGSATNSVVATSIKEANNSTPFTVYPNPNNGNFVVKSNASATLYIYDVTGKQVLSKKITEMETPFNMSQFENGIYFINISTDTKSFSHKIIVNK